MHHRFGRFDRVGQERLEVGIGSRAVDQKADVEIVGGRGDCGRGVVFCEIDCQRAGFDTGTGGDPGGHLVEHALAARHQHDVDPALGNALGERRADAVGCAGDQRPRAVLGCKCHVAS